MDPQDTLVVIGYSAESTADVARERLQVLSVEGLISAEIAAILLKDASGAVKVQRPHSHHGMPHLRGRKHDGHELDERVTLEASHALQPGGAALCLLVHHVAPEQVIPELSKYGGVVIKTSLPVEREQLLKDAFAQQLTSTQIEEELRH